MKDEQEAECERDRTVLRISLEGLHGVLMSRLCDLAYDDLEARTIPSLTIAEIQD